MAHRHNNNTGYTSAAGGGIADTDDDEELAFDHTRAYSPAVLAPPVAAEPPKVSHHQPCPNHVGGKTFAEIGTQTLPKKTKQQYHHPSNGSASSSSLNTLGCAAGIKQR